jgi:two-component system, NtrC family, nitrogen regulation sensor histidine kinase NtrY
MANYQPRQPGPLPLWPFPPRLSLILMAITTSCVIAGRFVAKRTPDTALFTKQLVQKQERILDQMQTQAVEMQRYIALHESLSQSQLLALSKFPAYLYKDTTLTFWSQPNQIPPSLPPDSGWHIAATPRGIAYQYVAYPKGFIKGLSNISDSTAYKLVILDYIYARYPVSNAWLKPGWQNADFNKVRVSIPQLPNKLNLPVGVNSDSVSKGFKNRVQKDSANLIYSPNTHIPLLKLEVLLGSGIAQNQQQTEVLVVLVIGSCTWLMGMLIWLRALNKKRRYWWGLLCVWAMLLLLRLAFALPWFSAALNSLPTFFPWPVPTEPWAPSLGILFLNAITATLALTLTFRHFLRLSNREPQLYNNKSIQRTEELIGNQTTGKALELPLVLVTPALIQSALLSLAFFGTVGIAYALLRSLFAHPESVLVVSRLVDFNAPQLLSGILFLIVALGLFFALHILARLLCRISCANRRHTWYGFFAASALSALMLGFSGGYAAPLLLLAIIVLSANIHLRLPEYLLRLRYQTYFYLFSLALLGALAGALGFGRYQARHARQERSAVARRLTAADSQGQFLLNELANQLRADTALAQRIASTLHRSPTSDSLNTTTENTPTPPTNEIEPSTASIDSTKSITKQLNNLLSGTALAIAKQPYFEPYEAEIGLYTSAGSLIAGGAQESNRNTLRRFLGKKMGATAYQGLYYSHLPTDEVFKRYIVLADLPPLRDSFSGAAVASPTLALDLKMSRLPERGVFPALLVNASTGLPLSPPESSSYSVYDSGQIVQQDGSFNYQREFVTSWLTERGQITTKRSNGWEHTIFPEPDGTTIVVSERDTRVSEIASVFSFLLLLLVGLIVTFVLTFTLYEQGKNRSLTFAGKIQVYLNGAFFLPLIVFGLLSFTLVELSLRSDLNTSYLTRARQAATTLEPLLNAYTQGTLSEKQLQADLDNLARFTGLDASLYTPQGRLRYATQPLVYRQGILSTYINPEALTRLASEGLHQTLLEEEIGTLKYATVYVACRLPRSRKVAAILAVPFFNSGSELKEELGSALSTVVNAFTGVLIAFMVLSYFASQVLVVPLKLISSRLRRTSLVGNEPLTWPSADEIGLLVQSYNNMLAKLEQSRLALSQSEKESAWREMAQQVAHEIKNPLTPLRLSIQQLLRRLPEGESAPADTVLQARNTLNGLLNQVDLLTEIASSFSTFARLPDPSPTIFPLLPLLERTAALHRTTGAQIQVQASTILQDSGAPLFADEGILQGIFSNLILNGIQSVPDTRLPILDITLIQEANSYQIRFADNGSGIPQELESKIFQPNFSTKFNGSGIGLALARRGIIQAGGSISFESIQGQGTVFIVMLPYNEKPPSIG